MDRETPVVPSCGDQAPLVTFCCLLVVFVLRGGRLPCSRFCWLGRPTPNLPFSSLALTGPRLFVSPCRSPSVVVAGGSLRLCPASAVLCYLFPSTSPNDFPVQPCSLCTRRALRVPTTPPAHRRSGYSWPTRSRSVWSMAYLSTPSSCPPESGRGARGGGRLVAGWEWRRSPPPRGVWHAFPRESSCPVGCSGGSTARPWSAAQERESAPVGQPLPFVTRVATPSRRESNDSDPHVLLIVSLPSSLSFKSPKTTTIRELLALPVNHGDSP